MYAHPECQSLNPSLQTLCARGPRLQMADAQEELLKQVSSREQELSALAAERDSLQQTSVRAGFGGVSAGQG